jgi:hypothetical protein
MEHEITGRLKFDCEAGEKDGVIGGEVYPEGVFSNHVVPSHREH